MHRHTIPDHRPRDLGDGLDQAILALLVHDHVGLWSLSELDRSLASGAEAVSGAEPARHATEDALARLYAAGLVGRVGQYVFATRSAHEAQHLVA